MAKMMWLVLLAVSYTPLAHAEENWKTVSNQDGESVAIDMASLVRQQQRISFRERRVYAKPRPDQESLRNIAEVQLRRLVDCVEGKLSVLSSSAFSDRNVLVRYEAIKRDKASFALPGNELEKLIIQLVCGAA